MVLQTAIISGRYFKRPTWNRWFSNETIITYFKGIQEEMLQAQEIPSDGFLQLFEDFVADDYVLGDYIITLSPEEVEDMKLMYKILLREIKNNEALTDCLTVSFEKLFPFLQPQEKRTPSKIVINKEYM